MSEEEKPKIVVPDIYFDGCIVSDEVSPDAMIVVDGQVTRMCFHIGVSGITDAVVKQLDDGTFEARQGVSIFGSFNEKNETEDPFDPAFEDNFAIGTGPTREDALRALFDAKCKMADSLYD